MISYRAGIGIRPRKRAIATEQGKLDRRMPATSSDSHRSSSEFHKVLPNSSEGETPEEMLTRAPGARVLPMFCSVSAPFEGRLPI